MSATAVAMVASPAAADPPAIQAAGASGGIVTAQWTLPPTVGTEFFEVARYPDVNAYGYFRCNASRADCTSDNPDVVRFGVLHGDQTSLEPGDAKPPLPAGTYYIHIAGHDSVHRACPLIEFSDIVQVTIDANGNGTSQGVVAPGTGSCTLIQPVGGSGSGGGGGGSAGGGKAIPGDKTAPTTQLRYPRRQDIDKLAIRARMSEPGTLTLRAVVDTGGLLARIYVFKPVTRKASGGLLVKLRPKIAKRHKRALKRAMRRGKRLRARATVTAVDRAGNETNKHLVIRLKP